LLCAAAASTVTDRFHITGPHHDGCLKLLQSAALKIFAQSLKNQTINKTSDNTVRVKVLHTQESIRTQTWNMCTLLAVGGCCSSSDSTTDFFALDFAKSSYNWIWHSNRLSPTVNC